MRTASRLLALLGLALGLALHAGAVSAKTKEAATKSPVLVVLVRHAEVDPGGSDPGLSEAGRARAAALAEALRDTDVQGIVTSRFRRTRDTAAPLAESRDVTPVAVGMTRESGLDGHVRDVAEAVRACGGGAVVVVGHSNTVPRIVRALGGPELPDLDEGDHASLFVLATDADGTVSCVRSRYGP